MPNKHEFSFHKNCMATIGKLSHADLKEKFYGSANMHRRFGYKMSSGLWHKKDGYQGRKIRPLPPVRLLNSPASDSPPKQKFTLKKRQLSSFFGTSATDQLVTSTNFRF